MRWSMVALLGAACLDPGTVELQGIVLQGWDDGAQPAGGVTIRTLDEVGTEVDRTTSLDSGWYRLEALAGGRVFLSTEGDGLVPSVFSGVSGLNPRLRVPNGQMFAVTSDRWEAEAALWDGCPGVGTDGSVFGIVELLDFEGGSDTGPIQIQTARIKLVTEDEREIPACYLDDDGVYAPDAAETGIRSRFMIGGVPAGRHTIQLDWTPFEGFDESATYDVWVPEDGLAPRFPLYVTFTPES